MNELTGKTRYFDGIKVKIYYHDTYLKQVLIWSEETGMKWIKESDLEEKSCGNQLELFTDEELDKCMKSLI